MLWIGLVNILKHGIPVQNVQDGVRLDGFHMELFIRSEYKKFWLSQSQIFTENLSTGKIEYKTAKSGKHMPMDSAVKPQNDRYKYSEQQVSIRNSKLASRESEGFQPSPRRLKFAITACPRAMPPSLAGTS
jgi:hypothetical protein